MQEPPLVIGGVDVSGHKDGLAPFRGEADEAPAWALRARREFSGLEDGFEEPDDEEDPYEVTSGPVLARVHSQSIRNESARPARSAATTEVSRSPSTEVTWTRCHVHGMSAV